MIVTREINTVAKELNVKVFDKFKLERGAVTPKICTMFADCSKVV